MKKRKISKITFTDNQGRTMNLNGKMTLRELLKIGVVKIDVVPKGSPLPDNCFREARK